MSKGFIPNRVIILDADTNQYLDCYNEMRDISRAVHRYDYNGTTIVWYKRTPFENFNTFLGSLIKIGEKTDE